MPKIQKVIERLFTNIFPDDFRPGEYEFFLKFDENSNIEVNEDLKNLKDIYESLIKNHLNDFIILSKVEETIIQLRCKEIIDKEIRLSISTQRKVETKFSEAKTVRYIYARSLFYRRGSEINDIRVLVGKTDEYGDNVDDLYQNEFFMTLCKQKLIESMDKEIQHNLNVINSKMNVHV